MATPTPKPVTISVPEAGRDYLGLGRNASYEAARRGEIPVLKFGGKLRVPVVALERMLENAGGRRVAGGEISARPTVPLRPGQALRSGA